MKAIEFTLKLEPCTKGGSVFVKEVQESREGPFCQTCDCGKHFMGFIKHNPKYHTMQEFIGVACSDAMREAGIERPLIGTVVIEVTLQHKRPKNHYNADGELLVSKLEDRPHCWPSLTEMLDTIANGIAGHGFHRIEQHNGVIAKKEYGDHHQISVKVYAVQSYEIDIRCNQPTLFDMEF